MERNENLYVEELYVRASDLIDERKLVEAKAVIEELLAIDVTYGRAYNLLGWIYNEALNDLTEAERMYKLALKYAAEYGATYLNYLYVLLDSNRLEEAEKLIAKAKGVAEVDKANLYYIEARVFELKGDLKKAFINYSKAYNATLNSSFMNFLSGEKDRVRRKMGRLRSALAALTL